MPAAQPVSAIHDGVRSAPGSGPAGAERPADRAGAAGAAGPGQLSLTLQPATGAARQARQLVTEACARWDVPELVGPACTVVTELVNNVVAHAHTPMLLLLRLRGQYLSISVRDGSHVSPDPRGPASPTSPGGRGLIMVEAVAERWGYTPVAGGKVVWAVLRTRDGRWADGPARAG